jgi:predicted metal-dependent enzyme (double-stranded beta helix superfamily)
VPIDQVFVLVWGILAIVWGAALIAYRHQIADAARARREERRVAIGLVRQTAPLMIVIGSIFAVGGATIAISAIVRNLL